MPRDFWACRPGVLRLERLVNRRRDRQVEGRRELVDGRVSRAHRGLSTGLKVYPLVWRVVAGEGDWADEVMLVRAWGGLETAERVRE